MFRKRLVYILEYYNIELPLTFLLATFSSNLGHRRTTLVGIVVACEYILTRITYFHAQVKDANRIRLIFLHGSSQIVNTYLSVVLHELPEILLACAVYFFTFHTLVRKTE